jgi:hypothetical protein
MWILHGLRAEAGVYGCLGNHETLPTPKLTPKRWAVPPASGFCARMWRLSDLVRPRWR